MDRDPAQLVRDLVDQVWNGGDLDALASFYAPTFEHDGGTGTVEQLRAWHAADAATWRDTHYEVTHLVAHREADGAEVALRWRSTATLVGTFGPVTGAGQRVEADGAHFLRVEHDRITAVHSLSDTFAKAVQLGVRFLPPGDDRH